jgi:hypothetical protein
VKNKTFLLVLSLLAISPARADIAQVRTPFWQATYEKNLVVKLVAVDRNLDHVCKEFRDLVILSPGKTDLEPAEFAQMRNQTDSITSQGFSANFKVELSAVTAAEGNGAMLGNAAQPRTALPEFDQKIARVVPTVAPIIGSDGQVSVVAAKDSLTWIAKSLGLKSQRQRFLGTENSTVVQVFGKDLACDLYSGYAHLEYESTVKVSISLESQTRLDDFYRQVEEMTRAVFASQKSSARRAALFGFRLYDLLAPLHLEHGQGEEMTGAIVDLLFDENMRKSSVWSQFDGQDHLNFPGSVQASIHVRMEK